MKDCDLVDAVEDAGLGELTSEAPISEVLERACVTALREGCSPDQYMPALRSL